MTTRPRRKDRNGSHANSTQQPATTAPPQGDTVTELDLELSNDDTVKDYWRLHNDTRAVAASETEMRRRAEAEAGQHGSRLMQLRQEADRIAAEMGTAQRAYDQATAAAEHHTRTADDANRRADDHAKVVDLLCRANNRQHPSELEPPTPPAAATVADPLNASFQEIEAAQAAAHRAAADVPGALVSTGTGVDTQAMPAAELNGSAP